MSQFIRQFLEVDFYVSTFFAIEFPRQRFKIGVPHSDFYSSGKPTYNQRVTDRVTISEFVVQEARSVRPEYWRVGTMLSRSPRES
jgi:hypothetical protein